MKTRFAITLVATAMALASATATATLKNVENAYESDAAHVLLPSSGGGQVIIRACPGCKAVVLRVNRDTAYLTGSPSAPVSLAALRAAADADGADHRLLTVFYNIESGVVTRIVLGAG